MGTEYKYEGETFLLDDSKGCYVEVTYKDQTGYLGLAFGGTEDMPYRWSDGRPDHQGYLNSGNSSGKDPEKNLQGLCKDLIRRHRVAESRKAFDPEKACETLHEFVGKLP